MSDVKNQLGQMSNVKKSIRLNVICQKLIRSNVKCQKSIRSNVKCQKSIRSNVKCKKSIRSNVKCQKSIRIILTERTSGVPPVIFTTCITASIGCHKQYYWFNWSQGLVLLVQLVTTTGNSCSIGYDYLLLALGESPVTPTRG